MFTSVPARGAIALLATQTSRAIRNILASSYMYRLAIGLVGLSVVIASAVAALVLLYLATEGVGSDWLAVARTVIGVAAPLYGTIAALHAARLPPLILGIALSAGALLWLCALADVPLELPERLS
jgi:hypothetical protein